MLPALPPEIAAILHRKTVLCGFSGGADSLALLLILHELAAEFSFSLRAVHFEHGFRGEESLQDAEFCREKCAALQIPFQQFSLHVPEHKLPGEGDEAAARRLRMEQWRILCGEYAGNAVVALGHHAGDAVENLLLRLMRGSNVSGLTSFRKISSLNGNLFVRPLFDCTKKEIENFLISRGETWRTDSTNPESAYGRNFLRNRILPELAEKFPYAEGGLQRTLENLTSDADFLEKSAEKLYAEMLAENRFSAADWLAIHPALLPRVLRLFLGSEAALLPGAFYERFTHELQNLPEHGFKRLLLPGITLYLSAEKSSAVRETPQEKMLLWNWRKIPEIRFGNAVLTAQILTVPPEIPPDASCAVFDAAEIPENLCVRLRADGDTMIPFGGTEEPVHVKKLVSGAKLEYADRAAVFAVCTPENRILWLPGVRRSNAAPVRAETREFLQLTVFR